MLKLIIEDDEGRKTVVPFVRDEITIGRQEGNTIRLTERNVSRRHARLLRQAGAVKIEDLGSANGIKVNGDRIAGLVQVSDGDLIQIGDYDLAIQREDERTAGAPTPLQLPLNRAAVLARLPTDARETAPTMPALPAFAPASAAPTPAPFARPAEALANDDRDETQEATQDEARPQPQSTSVIRVDQIQNNRREIVELEPGESPRLVVLNTEFAGREFLILKTETRIGRVDDNDITIDHRSLSRTHCKVVREDNGEWRVIDLQSANGLMLNGEPYAQVTLRHGDVIELGHVKMKFVGPGESFESTSGATVVATGEFDQVTDSRVPVIAVLVTMLVLVAGGGGYMQFKAHQQAAPETQPPVVVTPEVVEPVEDPSVQALTQAQEALDTMNLEKAEAVLRGCQSNGVLCPQVTAMLALIEAEKKVELATQNAQAALERQDLPAARGFLDTAAVTKVFKPKVTELEERYRKLLADKQQALAKRPTPLALPTRRAVAQVDSTEKLIAEAKSLLEEAALTSALNRLKQCLKIDPSHLGCTRLTASTYAKMGDYKTAREYYELYLRVAPLDDPYVVKIRTILDNAADSKQ